MPLFVLHREEETIERTRRTKASLRAPTDRAGPHDASHAFVVRGRVHHRRFSDVGARLQSTVCDGFDPRVLKRDVAQHEARWCWHVDMPRTLTTIQLESVCHDIWHAKVVGSLGAEVARAGNPCPAQLPHDAPARVVQRQGANIDPVFPSRLDLI